MYLCPGSIHQINGIRDGTPFATEGVAEGKIVNTFGLMKLSFDNAAYKLWLQEIMTQFVLTVRPGTNHWYLSHSVV